MEPLSLEAMTTIAGATLAAGLLTQATKVMLGTVPDLWVRRMSLFYGVVVMLIATFTIGVEGRGVFLVAAMNGVIAGLAASGAYEVVRHGESRLVNND